MPERNKYLSGLSATGFKQIGVVERRPRYHGQPRVSIAIAIIGLVIKFILKQQFLHWPFGLTSIFFLGGI